MQSDHTNKADRQPHLKHDHNEHARAPHKENPSASCAACDAEFDEFEREEIDNYVYTEKMSVTTSTGLATWRRGLQ